MVRLNALKASTAIALVATFGWVSVSDSSANDSNSHWAGGSFGFHAGWGIGNSSTQSDYSNSDYLSNDTEISGGLFGVQAGYDWAISHGLIVGVGAQFSGVDINGTDLDKYCDPDCSGFDETKVDALASVTGRIGWVGSDPSTLFYARGGLAWAQVHYGWLPSSYSESHTQSNGHTGWTVGAGVEKSLTSWPGVTARLEYNYYDFGSGKGVGVADGYNVDGDLDIHTVMFGLNLRPGMNDDALHSGSSGSYDWSGFSVGVHGGWAAGASENHSDYSDPDWISNDTNLSGGLLGVRVGYDWDLNNRWVVGVGASISGTDINGFATDNYDPDDLSGLDETKVSSLLSVTGRVGWKGNDPSTLYYARGGLAQARVNYGWVPDSYDYSYTGAETHTGWTIGLGKEQALPFWPGATGFLEYNYYNFGNYQDISNNSDENVEGKFDVHAIMIGVNFRPWQQSEEDGSEETRDSDVMNAWWGGPSLGIHGAWNMGDAKTRSDWSSSDEDNDFDVSGGQIGIQAGYDWAVGDHWVLGVNASVAATDINGFYEEDDCATECGDLSEIKIDTLASVTGRVGWNGSDASTLYYARGGVAWAHASYDWQPSSYYYSYTGSTTHTGWTVGAGIEKKIPMFNNATVFAEYNYFDFGNWQDTDDTSSDDLEGKFNFHTAKIGLNVKFNGPQQ